MVKKSISTLEVSEAYFSASIMTSFGAFNSKLTKEEIENDKSVST